MASNGLVVAIGSFSSITTSSTFNIWGVYNLFIYGTFTGSIRLERSFDTGVTWVPVSCTQTGSDAAYTAPISLSFQEIEDGMIYRLNATALSAGTANYRISQGRHRLRF